MKGLDDWITGVHREPGQQLDNRTVGRVYRYVEKYFQRHAATEFPTVRRVARSLNMRQSEVVGEVEDDDRLDLEYYNMEGLTKVPIGEWFVYSYGQTTATEES